MSGPRALVVQHAGHESLGWLGVALAEAGAGAGVAVDAVRAFVGEPVPLRPNGHAAVVLLGGPMGACDDAHHPWLAVVVAHGAASRQTTSATGSRTAAPCS